jgi:hypothetical protein
VLLATHLDANLALHIDQLSVDELLLLLLEGGERPAEDALEAANRVLEVGRLHGGSALANGARLLAERDERPAGQGQQMSRPERFRCNAATVVGRNKSRARHCSIAHTGQGMPASSTALARRDACLAPL